MGEVQTETQKDIINIVKKYLETLKTQGTNIIASYLYGSYAKGAPHKDSDIDVAIISDDLSETFMDNWCKLNNIANRIDVRMEVVGFLPENFRDENPLAWEIKTKGIKLI